MKKEYIQFSKRCVTATLICVNSMVLMVLIGMVVSGEYMYVAEIMQHYLSFASVVFVAYCGNSAAEKIATKMAGGSVVHSTENNPMDNG